MSSYSLPLLSQAQITNLLHSIRSLTHWSQTQLAKRLGVSFSTISRWENQHCYPSAIALTQIQRLLEDLYQSATEQQRSDLEALLEQYFPQSPLLQKARTQAADSTEFQSERQQDGFTATSEQKQTVREAGQDSSRLKQIASLFQQGEAWFRSLFDVAPIGISLANVQTRRFVITNQAFQKMLGYSAEELRERTVESVTYPEDVTKDAEAVEQFLQGQMDSFHREKRYLTKAGDVIWVKITATLLCDPVTQQTYALGMIEDVTQEKISQREREQAKQALRESEDRWQLAIQGSNDGIWDWDILHQTIFFSAQWKAMLGFAVDEVEDNFDLWASRIHPDDRAGVNQILQDHLERKSPFYQSEHRLCCKDGTYKWILARGQALWDESGRAVRMVGSHTDISERKRVETILQERERLLRLFIQYAPASMVMLDRELRYVMASQRWVEDFHFDSIDSLLGRSHYEVFPEVSEEWKQVHQRCLAGAIEKCDEERFVRSDGSEQWLRWEIHPWYDQNQAVSGIIIFAEDITAQKLAQIQLRQSEERFRLAMEYAEIGTWDWDVTLDRITWNEQNFRLHGLPTQGIEPSFAVWRDCLYPADIAPAEQGFWQAVSTQGLYRTQYRVSWQDGTIHWLASRGRAVYSKLGHPIRVLGITLDISERKQAEQELQHAIEELTRLNRLKDDFLSTVSHELRTPMSNIKMATQMLEIRLQPLGLLTDASHAISRYFQVLKDECQREIGLINDLLDLARLDAGAEPLTLSTLDLSVVLAQIVAPFEERMHNQQQHFELLLSPNLPSVMTDRSYLERILAELLQNACKYTPMGEKIRIVAETISTADVVPEETTRFPSVQIQVSNSGVEIADIEQARIFDRFYRIPDRDPWRHGGTGLGLALVQKLAEQIRGQITVHSDSSWTTFTLTLPIT